MKEGFSLNNAYVYRSQEDLESFLNQQVCFYCEEHQVDYQNLIETNCLHGDLIYKICEKRFLCSHLNIIYIRMKEAQLKVSDFLVASPHYFLVLIILHLPNRFWSPNLFLAKLVG
ncbi:hypothetical protein MJH12_01505 [bacterium]|nr:hypothetical protein [bacterium]